ncbi:MAG: CapA family protein [Candidatus Berkiellales bacterium]
MTCNAGSTHKSIFVGLMGDVMLGRTLNEVIDHKGFDYPWGNMLKLLHQHDVNIINLETTLTRCREKAPKVFNFRADPEKVQSLQHAHIHIANLANNHILDFTEKGLLETIQVLAKANIKSVGAGKDNIEARAPLIYSVNGITLGVLGFTDNEPSWNATAQKPGTYYSKINLSSTIFADIQALRSQVDKIIVSVHWGPNNREVPSHEFVQVAHRMIESGADIIHGHSAHVVQGVEIYQGKIIFYDCGDFVDDYQVGPHRNDHGFLCQVTLTKDKIQRVRLIPTLISHYQVNLAEGEDREENLMRMKRLSKDFGTEFLERGQCLEIVF